MKFFKKPVKAEDVERNRRRFAFTFPVAEAELTDETIQSLNMHAALRSFARHVLEQYTTVNGKRVVGVEIHNIGITFILDAEERPQ